MTKSIFENKYTKDYDNLSEADKRQIFLSAIRDFYQKAITVYELSNVGTYIWSSLENKNSEFADVCMTASELEHYLHTMPPKGKESVVGKMFDEISKYFQKESERGKFPDR